MCVYNVRTRKEKLDFWLQVVPKRKAIYMNRLVFVMLKIYNMKYLVKNLSVNSYFHIQKCFFD